MLLIHLIIPCISRHTPMKLLFNRLPPRHPNRAYQLSSLFYCESAAVDGFSGYHRNPITSRKDDRARFSRRCRHVVVLFRVIDVHMLSVSRSYAPGCSACVRATILRARIVNSIRLACDCAPPKSSYAMSESRLVSGYENRAPCSRRLGSFQKRSMSRNRGIVATAYLFSGRSTEKCTVSSRGYYDRERS